MIDFAAKMAGANALMPFARRRIEESKRNELCFVHYTSAEVGISIARDQKISLRNATAMNDFSEIQHGQKCLDLALQGSAARQHARPALEECSPGAWDAAIQMYRAVLGSYEDNCYIFSMSEHGHGSVDEDQFGRLSMWRAYGGDTNVALVLNNRPFFSQTTALTAFTSPVLYATSDQFEQHLLELADSIRASAKLLSSLGVEFCARTLFGAFIFATLSTKHPGFSEEREWRIIYLPEMMPSKRIAHEIVCWGGLPQRVYNIPMKNYPDEGFTGAELQEVLKEVIIGPTNFPGLIADAYCEVLAQMGLVNAQDLVRISGIPLRR